MFLIFVFSWVYIPGYVFIVFLHHTTLFTYLLTTSTRLKNKGAKSCEFHEYFR